MMPAIQGCLTQELKLPMESVETKSRLDNLIEKNQDGLSTIRAFGLRDQEMFLISCVTPGVHRSYRPIKIPCNCLLNSHGISPKIKLAW